MNDLYPQMDNDGFGGQGYEIVRSTETKRRRRRQIVILVILLLLLALVTYAGYYFAVNRRLPLPGAEAAKAVVAPEYLYSISGPAGSKNALTRPIGVAVGKNDWVYATDTKARVVRVYEANGRYRSTISKIGGAALEAPAHLAVGPRDELYVSDRALRAIFVFTAEGQYLRKITPKGKDEKLWGPLGMGFDAKGNLYVTDAGVNEKHRILVFDPSGKEILRFGKTGRAEKMTEYPGDFYFPNGVLVNDKGEIFVSDSNNRRVEVFAADGKFERIIQTSGIPRGIVRDSQDRLYVVDALSHAIDIFGDDGKRIIGFGENGVGPGQFQYANDIDLDSRGRIYVSDRENHQIQVWGWPVEPVPTPTLPTTALGWLACLSPLLLLPLLLLLRKRTYVVAPQYLDEAIAAGLLPNMRDMRRTRFVMPAEDWDAYSGRMVDGIDVGHVVSPDAYSDTDVRALMERLHAPREDAILLAMGERTKRLCTTDARISGLAGALGVQVFGLDLLSSNSRRGSSAA